MRFVADSMLGRLAKWLRVLGHDVHYQSRYSPDALSCLVREGRILITRHRRVAEACHDSVLLSANDVTGQLNELEEKVSLPTDRATWFTRCLLCNVPLEKVPADQARENIPEHVFYQETAEIRSCPLCERYYWPGSHRTGMICQLEKWGF